MPRCAPALLILPLLLLGTPANAQRLRVTVVDAGTAAPVADAMVRVEDAAGEPVNALFTSPAGVAAVRVGAGGYLVFVQRAGYLPARETVEVAGGETALRVELRPRPFSIDTVQVIVAGREERGRSAFERRAQTENGVFLDPAYMQQQYEGAVFIADMLHDAPGLDLAHRSRGEYRVVVTHRGWRCLNVLIDGQLFEAGAPGGGVNQRRGPPLDHLLDPDDIVAVEVYPEGSQVPAEFARYAWEITQRFDARPCGLILYWTRDAW